ncbi:MAG: hypothetical protein KDE04_06480 [Anaerolineales bacterium]|nr:hypothetical protein [Anaerolineales bacterium]
MATPAGKQSSVGHSHIQQPAPTEKTSTEPSPTHFPALLPAGNLEELPTLRRQQHVQQLGRDRGNQFVLRYLAGRPVTVARSEDEAPTGGDGPVPEEKPEAATPVASEEPEGGDAVTPDETPAPTPVGGEEPEGTKESGDAVTPGDAPEAETPVESEESDGKTESDNAVTPDETPAPTPVPELAEGVVIDNVSVGTLIDTVLASSVLLKPYIGDKLKDKAIADASKLIIHKNDQRFEYEYMKLADKWELRDTDKGKQELAAKHGFYHGKSDTIHLRSDSTNQEMLHESIHKLADGHFGIFGEFGNEGATQYFTKRVIEEMGQTAPKNIYPEQVAFAEKLINYLTEPVAAEHFFNKHPTTELLTLVKVSLDDYRAKYQAGDAAKEAFKEYLETLF